MNEPESAPAPTDRLAGLLRHNAAERARTLERLHAAVAALHARAQPVSTSTIREECGLEYASYRRNPDALAFFRQHSTHLAAKRRRTVRHNHAGQSAPAATAQPDPLLQHKKPTLVARLRAAQAERDDLAARYGALLQEHMTCAETILRLRADVARYQEFLGHLRTERTTQEHSP